MHAVTVADDRHFVLACAHHVAWDAQSSVMLGHELSVFYEAYDHGAPIDLPPLRVQYADYSAHQRSKVEAGGGVEALDYWEERLAGNVPLTLPTDRPRRSKPDYACGRIAWSLDAGVSAKLRALAVERHTTIFNVVTAGIALAMGRAAGTRDVVLGTTVSTRDRHELDALLGCFVNTLPLRIDVDTADVCELLRRMQLATTEALSNNVPFDLIVERVGRTREVGRQPIYDVMVAGQSDAAQPPTDTFRVHRIEAVSTQIDRDFLFQVEQLADPIHGWTQYRIELYDEATVKDIVGDLEMVLDAMANRRIPPRPARS
jgi:arthrofactin-type cyclic lipopeptide synthetase C